MASLNGLMIIFAAISCSSQVYSEPTIMSAEYDFYNRQIVIGEHHIQNTTLAYALCQFGIYQQVARCRVILDGDAFDVEEPVYFCNIDLATEYENGTLDILSVDLLGQDKAIFTWRDINNDNLNYSDVTIVTMHMPYCAPTASKLTVDNREDMQSQIFINPSENSFFVTFANKFACGENYFCKMIIYDDGITSPPYSWFPSTVVIHSIERIEHHTNFLLIIVGDEPQYREKAKYFVLEGNKRTELARSFKVKEIGTSASNGFISLCSTSDCLIFDQDGTPLHTKSLNIQYNFTAYVDVYNMPNGGQLALVCDDEPRSNYRIIHIESTGIQKDAIDLDGLKCARIYHLMSTKFFMKNDIEYCLSIFHSMANRPGRIRFASYCFTLDDLMEIF